MNLGSKRCFFFFLLKTKSMTNHFGFICMALCWINFHTSKVHSFVPTTISHQIYTKLHASIKPKFNKSTNRWEEPPGYEDEETYGPIGSLLRQGPSPFLTRITKSGEYEQAVLKYMASENVSRLEAQGNMDAYFNNAADWSYQKMEEKRGAPKVDYTKVKTKDVILALIWATFITPLLVRIAFLIVVNGNWDVRVDQIVDFS